MMDTLSISQIKRYHESLLDISKYTTINSNTLKDISRKNKITNTAYIHMLKLGYISKSGHGIYSVNITAPDPKHARLLAVEARDYKKNTRQPTHYTQEYISKVTQAIIESNKGESRTRMAEILIEQIPGYYKDASTAVTRISREYRKSKQIHKNKLETVKAPGKNELNNKVSDPTQEALVIHLNLINDLKLRVGIIEKSLFKPPKMKRKKRIRMALKTKWNAIVSKLLIKN